MKDRFTPGQAAIAVNVIARPMDSDALWSKSDLAWQFISGFERILAFLMLLVLAPLLLAVGLIIATLSKSSPFIAHRRIGLDREPMWVLKFRTMWTTGSEENPGLPGLIEYVSDQCLPLQKSPYDQRVQNNFARFCRKYSIDELPQLWNVVAGELSLVGARPITESELNQHYGAAADEVLCLKPGITGLWQINGRNKLTYAERRHFDLVWTRSRSPLLYATILLATVPRVLSADDSW